MPIRSVYVNASNVVVEPMSGLISRQLYDVDPYWSTFPVRVLVTHTQAELDQVVASYDVTHFTHQLVYSSLLDTTCTWNGSSFVQSASLLQQIQDDNNEATRRSTAMADLAELRNVAGGTSGLTNAQQLRLLGRVLLYNALYIERLRREDKLTK